MEKNHLKAICKGFQLEMLNKDLKLVFASNLVGSFGDGLYAYLLPYYITKTLSASSVEVGILFAVVTLVAALTLFLAGMFADKYDRKKIMIAGWIAWIPAPLIFSVAENWLQMLPGMILWGFWLGGPTSTAYIVNAADKDKLTLTFTAMSAAWSFGYVFSPAIGGFIAENVGMHLVFYLSFVFYTIAGLILVFISSQRANIQEKTHESYSLFKLLRTGKLAKISIFFATIMFFLMMFRPFVPEFLAEMYHYGDFEIGFLGSVLFFGSAVLGIMLGKLGDRTRKSHALSVSLIMCCVSLILLMLSDNFYILTVAFFITGGSYLTWSLMNAIIGPMAPEQIRAKWVSIPQTIAMFSSFIAPYVGGVLYSASPNYPFIIAIIATLSLAFLALYQILD